MLKNISLAIALVAGALLGAPVAAAQNIQTDLVTVGQPAVVPQEFNGDLSGMRYTGTTVGAPKVYMSRLPGPAVAKVFTGTSAPPTVAPLAGPLAPMPPTVQNFPGLSFNDLCTGGQCGAGWPPDTNGDVGPNHYIQVVNDAVAIYNKTGTLLTSFTENNLWAGSGSTPCNGNSFGDPVALYDWLADRFIITWFAFAVVSGNPVSPFYQCIAASKTSDPVAGGWWLYPVRMDPGTAGTPPVGNLNDYGKFGLWHDCLYMGANEFLFPAGSYQGVAVASFSRADMYSGAPLTYAIGFLPYPANDVFTLVPSNNNGKGIRAVPPGTPNYLVSESANIFSFLVRKFTPGPNCGGGGTVGAPTFVSQTAYNFVFGNIVPQPNTATTLDMIDDRIMQKAQYRKVGAAESIWVTHVGQVTSTTNTTMQWAQLDITGGVVAAAPVQQGFQQPDATLFRFMGSIAADRMGNVALGYSTSNGTSPNFPSLMYAGRLASDPLNTLPQTEVTMVAGAGSQANICGGGPCDRWGDYSGMSVDPADDCTFWYTNEYYTSQVNGTAGNWNTRIGSFVFPGCATLATTTTGIGSSANPSIAGNNVTFTATVNGTLPTGTVDFQDAFVSIPGCNAQPLVGGGNSPTATCMTNALTVGTHSIVANYSGDGGSLASNSAPLLQVVSSPGGGLGCAPNPAQELANVSCILTISGNNPTGFVKFLDGAAPIPGCGGVPLAGSGNTKTATCNTTSLSVGSHDLSAVYSGDKVNPGGASNTVVEVINPRPATSTAVTSSANPSSYGMPVTFTATVTGASPTGTINFKDGATVLPGCGAKAMAGGVATCTAPTMAVGTHSITGIYSGDLNNAPSTSPPLSQVVNCTTGKCPAP